MGKADDFDQVFKSLKPLLEAHAPRLLVKADTDAAYYLDTHAIMQNKQPLFFGSVQIKKTYVSYYLMPVYIFPDLLEGMSPALKKRMQGKSCFNFTAVDEALLSELAALTDAGMARYEQQGMLEGTYKI